ncbi:hypothetical protein HW555_001329 [Spodoptera exigua]|uniref:Uncharacterized protein n=1 Tax=Spodoptera exigua TaxID=7107 RepID=A0A835GPK4_SPOEX|nr:hypothetical protein HW555_001329 [Spodoptera exigua]
MSKIILFVALVTLMCVSAQNNNNWGLGGNYDYTLPKWLSNFQNIMKDQKENLNIKPGPNENYVAAGVKSVSQDGKIHTTVYQDINGQKKEFTITN